MGKGSVVRRGSVWSFVVDLGPDPATDRRRRARRSGFATKKEAEAALRSLATVIISGKVPYASSPVRAAAQLVIWSRIVSAMRCSSTVRLDSLAASPRASGRRLVSVMMRA